MTLLLLSSGTSCAFPYVLLASNGIRRRRQRIRGAAPYKRVNSVLLAVNILRLKRRPARVLATTVFSYSLTKFTFLLYVSHDILYCTVICYMCIYYCFLVYLCHFHRLQYKFKYLNFSFITIL